MPIAAHRKPARGRGGRKGPSQLRMGSDSARRRGFYFKLFVACSWRGKCPAAFFIKHRRDPRFVLGLGALAAVIVNTYVTSSLVPDTA